MRYDRMQTQLLPLAVSLVAMALILLGVRGNSDGRLTAVVGLGMALVVLIGWAFSGMRTTVDDDTLTVAFRLGWPRKTITLADVNSAVAVRNKWWWGFGIRVIPGGMLWNVWGLDAVELDVTGRRTRFRVGTDDPSGLAAALNDAIDRRRGSR